MESNGLGDATSASAACSASSGASCGAAPYAAADHVFNVEVTVTMEDTYVTMKTDESYTLDVTTQEAAGITTAYINAPTFFGARHAMETLTQLMSWDDIVNSLVVIQDATIKDRPVFPHRGLLIDASRNYIEIPLLKRIIDGLSFDKMNVLHWHLTDSHSFPFVSTREPLMAIYGAYSARQVYRPQEIQDLVRYAQVRGVKIVPEFDGGCLDNFFISSFLVDHLRFVGPAHTGAGWEWGPQYE